jgi:hypothetical protein
VAAELRADQPGVPRPAVLGVGGGVDAEPAVTGPDVALEGGLLRVVEQVAGGRQEHRGLVAGEAGVGDPVGVLGGVDLQAELDADVAQRVDAVGDGLVAEAGGLGEDQHPVGPAAGGGGGGRGGGGRGGRSGGVPGFAAAGKGGGEGQAEHERGSQAWPWAGARCGHLPQPVVNGAHRHPPRRWLGTWTDPA